MRCSRRAACSSPNTPAATSPSHHHTRGLPESTTEAHCTGCRCTNSIMSTPAHTVEQATELGEGYMEVPFHRFLGARLESLSKEACTISFDTTEQLLTPMGTLHAAAIYTALELANVMAILPHITPDETAMSIQHTVSLIGTVGGLNQRVMVRSKMLKRGSSVAFFESEAYNPTDMSILAKGNTTKAIKKIRKKEVPRRDSKL